MNAGRLLRQTGYLTDALLVRIAPVDPDDVDIFPAAPALMRLWRPGIKGVTHWRWVFVDPELMKGDRDRLARLVIHELIHVRQFRDAGYLPFMTRYALEYWRGRLAGKDPGRAYLDIGAETEARRLAEQVISAR